MSNRADLDHGAYTEEVALADLAREDWELVADALVDHAVTLEAVGGFARMIDLSPALGDARLRTAAACRAAADTIRARRRL